MADGRTVTAAQELEKTISAFYKTLYAAHPISAAHTEAEEHFLHLLPARFTENCPATIVADLGAIPGKDKLGRAVKAIAKERNPGLDSKRLEC
jgi:hypothetical protein